MIEPRPTFPDNPNHANGTCEDCGCHWCPSCYDAGRRELVVEMATQRLLREIRVLRPELDRSAICAWAYAQAQVSPECDSLHYLAVADRAVVTGEPLPWLPAPSGLTPPLPVTN